MELASALEVVELLQFETAQNKDEEETWEEEEINVDDDAPNKENEDDVGEEQDNAIEKNIENHVKKLNLI